MSLNNKFEDPVTDQRIESLIRWGDYKRAEEVLTEKGKRYINYEKYYKRISRYKKAKRDEIERQESLRGLLGDE